MFTPFLTSIAQELNFIFEEEKYISINEYKTAAKQPFHSRIMIKKSRDFRLDYVGSERGSRTPVTPEADMNPEFN